MTTSSSLHSIPAAAATGDHAAAVKRSIADQARALGFDDVAFATAEADARTACELDGYLAAGCHGAMEWMAETAARRATPRGLWPEVRSIIVLGTNYGPAGDPGATLAHAERGTVSVYARNKDYHDPVKKRLKALARWLVERHGGDVKVFVDTAPVMEKPLAQRAGLGWQGKHTNVVSRRYGSWLFLAEIYTTLDLAPDAPQRDLCGTCRRCIDACPTGAITGPHRIEPRRCISYLTIEHKGHIPAGLRPLMGNRIYGCDDCLAVCPWNSFAVPTKDADYLPRAELTAPRLADLADLDDAGFRQVFAGSPIKRVGRDRFTRNVLVAIGNSGVGDLADVAMARLRDDSPLVRAMAVWALRRLLPPDRLAVPRERSLADEADAAVVAEWSDDPSAGN